MYNQKMVCCLKANGKVLREFKDTVYVPFGSEYSILIKNLNSVRAIVNITIDGQEVVPDGLVVNANQEIDLERFVKDLSKGNKFKFIERTANIENGPRGIKVDDGLIRVSFKYEKVYPQLVNTIHHHIWNTNTVYGNGSPRWSTGISGSLNTPIGASTTGGSSDTDMRYAMNSIATSAMPTKGITRGIVAQAQSATSDKFFAQASGVQLSAPKSEVGITVPGSISEQKFTTISNFTTEPVEHVMVLRLAGDLGQKPVTEPVTVKAKPKCQTCGKVNKAVNKCCSECGTSLIVF
jgi:hypothetical protein